MIAINLEFVEFDIKIFNHVFELVLVVIH
jgi:hypothetical protein